MELKDLEKNPSGSYDLVSKKIKEIDRLTVGNSVIVCQSLNGQKKILADCVINKNLNDLLKSIKASHSNGKGNIYFDDAPKGAKISRIYLLTFLNLENTNTDSIDWLQVPSLIDLKPLEVSVITTDQAILYIVNF